MNPSNQVCDNCRFYKPIGPHVGQCRCHAPTANGSDQAIWPWITDDAWCGEWKQTFEAEEKAWQEHTAFTKSVHEKQ